MSAAASQTVPPPDLGIPPSPHTVDVSIINTGATIRGIPTRLFLAPSIKGHEWLAAPAFSFLIQHPGLNRALVFDLGIRKDWENLSPPLLSHIRDLGWTLHAEKDVQGVLREGGVDSDSIEAIVWSHYHFDHIGNPNTFGPGTSLIVGPGFKAKLLPGYPTSPSASILESDHAHRELIELDFATGASGSHSYAPLRIGRLRALDYFNDGSFYLLDTPGHAIGHICGLARVTSAPPSYILLAGDAFHHAGELRPSRHLPLPQDITPDPFVPDPHPLDYHYGCPGAIFGPLLRSANSPFYEPARLDGSFHEDVDEMLRTIEKLQEIDAQANVLSAAAHDESLMGVLEFFPRGKLNAFVEQGTVRRVEWRFLKDFARSVGKQGHELGLKREWSAEPEGEGAPS